VKWTWVIALTIIVKCLVQGVAVVLGRAEADGHKEALVIGGLPVNIDVLTG